MGQKEFYSGYNNGHVIYDCNKRIVGEINKLSPASVLEFGCGTGKNLNLIEAGVRVGIDLSKVAIEEGKIHYRGLELYVGDEEYLSIFRDKEFHVSFTVSVLNHIKDIGEIVSELRRVSTTLFCMESQDVWHEYCYSHDYRSYGFHDIGYRWRSPFTGAVYRLWVM